MTHEGHQWTTWLGGVLYNAYPLYDWRTEDIFLGVAERGRRTLVESFYLTSAGTPTVANRLLSSAVRHFGHDRDLHAIVRRDRDRLAPYGHAGFVAVGETTGFIKLLRAADLRDAQH
ncbi:hypothetical protein [Saccharopolyspora phatthalungensis]|uniref:Uncharacterized protein n=1 Tax=Saccharopolyspora phatthalungensis TaxID=664693 RepID=A0A840QF21_9PSEU|nr:hypothetical protein [Saccharopolyspora phatthalungensis]MBB5159424.1 hypothetical protein [Saccharopolyspora phatthalungensis]